MIYWWIPSISSLIIVLNYLNRSDLLGRKERVEGSWASFSVLSATVILTVFFSYEIAERLALLVANDQNWPTFPLSIGLFFGVLLLILLFLMFTGRTLSLKKTLLEEARDEIIQELKEFRREFRRYKEPASRTGEGGRDIPGGGEGEVKEQSDVTGEGKGIGETGDEDTGSEEGGNEEEEIPQIPSRGTRQKSEFEDAVGELKNTLEGPASEKEIVEKFGKLRKTGCKFAVGKTKGKEYLKVRKSIGGEKHERSLGRVSPRVKRMAEEAGIDV